MSEGVRLTIDGRDVEVPAGTGLVEAAAALDVEIPVFCYEPRIGAPLGACRMCMVEVEGMPKLQAACSMQVRDGMVVSTVSKKAREAQEAVLEFLLLNHPLDCPVCDKGGECPLQDHAFRWGAGTTRLDMMKRNSDKPIPVSPLIALDRERCILCYRCTRFSSEVAQDDQLITRERGAKSVIATFEGRPYEGHLSGNVIELCPVGALTSTEYRFDARPWESVEQPSVCGGCAVGCNTQPTVREGCVSRVLARRNDAVDEGWLCDKGRFSYPGLYAPERILVPQERLHRSRPVGNRPVVESSHELAMEWLHERIAGEAGGALWVLSGQETIEAAWAVRQLAAASGGRVVAAPGASAAAPAPERRATLADLQVARHVLVLGDADLLDVAPILDVRIRKALRAGASVTVAGAGGTRLEAAEGVAFERVEAGELDAFVSDFCARMTAAAGGSDMEEPGVVVHRDGELSDESLDLLAATFALPREGSGLLAVCEQPNARGLAALGIEQAGWDEILGHRGGLVLMDADPSRHVPAEQWLAGMKSAAWVACVGMHHTPVHDAADMVIPAVGHAEQDGCIVNLEGRLQRLTVAAFPPDGVRTPLQWVSGLARRLGATAPAHAAGVYRLAARDAAGTLPAASHGEIPSGGVLGVAGGTAPTRRDPAAPGAERGGAMALYVAPFLYDDAQVAASPKMSFLHETARLVVSRDDADERGLAHGDRVRVMVHGREVEAELQSSRRIGRGRARIHAGSGLVPRGRTGWTSTAWPVPATAPATPATTASVEG